MRTYPRSPDTSFRGWVPGVDKTGPDFARRRPALGFLSRQINDAALFGIGADIADAALIDRPRDGANTLDLGSMIAYLSGCLTRR